MTMMPWKINYPCGCQFNGQDFPDPPEYCPAHGRPETLFGLPIVKIDGCPSCAALRAEVDAIMQYFVGAEFERLGDMKGKPPEFFRRLGEGAAERTKEIITRLALAEKTLKGIADNTCCEGCQEAAKVASAALKETP